MYWTCTVGTEALKTIYQSILSQHISQGGFTNQIAKIVDKVVTSALNLHQKVASTFLPTAIKFHYIFNLRDLSNIFQVSYRVTYMYMYMSDYSRYSSYHVALLPQQLESRIHVYAV